ncbi:matrix metalloproteinase-18-like isoform X1 [Asterias amurensis]|uniref:matrix metalloproteinase-18-like isoform X1 n=2 Tax=Asterias amurensis TaxID=7602 RepID=UPI003AB768FB
MDFFEMTLPLLLLLVSIRDVILVQSAAVQPLQMGMGFLERYGYMAPPDPNAAKLISEIEVRQGIMKMQQFFRLPQTGIMDEETVEMMQKPRCGMPDLPDLLTRYKWSGRNKRYSTQGTVPWSNFDLTYSFDSYTPDIPRDQVREAIQRAFKVWSDVTPLTFREIQGGEPDIHIDFTTRSHSDDYAFDGPGGTLAHAFFPGPGLGGDAHFDDDETFTYQMYSGTNLFIVAAHELGHSLGLGHSNVEGALMAPYYQGYMPDFKLSYDDVSGVQSLYGRNPNPNPNPRPAPRPRPTILPPKQPETPKPTPSPTCTGGFGAVADIRGEVFIFKGEDMWRLSGGGELLSGYPMPTRTFWSRAPSSPDAVFEKIDGTITFVKGFKHWEFNGLDLKAGFPQDIASFTGNQISDVNSALALKSEGFTYFFNGALCWRYDGNAMQMEDGYPRRISDEWSGGPEKVDAAFRFDGATYLIEGNQYWSYSDGSMKADVIKQPRWFTVDFLGCSLDTVVTEEEGDGSRATRTLFSFSIGALATLMALVLCR